MTKRKYSILAFLLISIAIYGQKIGVSYITALDTADIKHNLTFYKDGTIEISYPKGPGVYWNDTINESKMFSYSNNQDTIIIYIENDSGYTDFTEIETRLLDSKFIILEKKHLFDCNSGYYYISIKQAKKMRYGAIAFEGKVYTIKKGKNLALKKILRDYESDDLTSKVLRGKSALDKYGPKGIHGIIEIRKK